MNTASGLETGQGHGNHGTMEPWKPKYVLIKKKECTSSHWLPHYYVTNQCPCPSMSKFITFNIIPPTCRPGFPYLPRCPRLWRRSWSVWRRFRPKSGAAPSRMLSQRFSPERSRDRWWWNCRRFDDEDFENVLRATWCSKWEEGKTWQRLPLIGEILHTYAHLLGLSRTFQGHRFGRSKIPKSNLQNR